MDTASARRRIAAALALIAGGGLAAVGGPAPVARAAGLPGIFVNPPSITPDPIGFGQLPAVFTVHPNVDPAATYLLTVDGVPQQFTVVDNQMTFTASPSCGGHTANISLDNSVPEPGARPRGESTGTNISFFVACVRLDPSSIPFSGQPATVTVTGDDWIPDAPVTLTLDGHPIGQPAETDEVDTFVTTITVSGLGCTPHTITADQPPPVETNYSEVTASAQLTVTGCPSTTPSSPPPSRANPKIVANPAVVTDGALTHVTGTGFAPNQPITLTWIAGPTPPPTPLPAGTGSACSPNADTAPALTADASGKIDVYCYARPHEIIGAAQLVAVQGTARATAPVVVEGGSMQPSSGDDQFVFRR